MTTNEQRETAAILQMRKDLDEAQKLIGFADIYVRGFISLTKLRYPSEDMSYAVQDSEKMREFLARTELTK